MRLVGLGHGLFATAGAGLAILSLTYGGFAPIWQPLPAWIPWREAWIYGCGLLVLAASVGLCFSRTAPSLFAQPPPEWATPPRNQWSELVVTLLLAASAWVVATSLQNRPWGFASRSRTHRDVSDPL